MYIYEHCPFCARVRYVARMLDIQLEEIIVDYSDNTTINRLIGKKVVPNLIKEDGTPMTESGDIIHYFIELKKSKTPQTPQNNTLEWQTRAFPLLQYIGYPRWSQLKLGEFLIEESRQLWKEKKQTATLNFSNLLEQTESIVKQVDIIVKEATSLLDLQSGASQLPIIDQAIYFSILRGLYSEPSIYWPTELHTWLIDQSQALNVPLLK